MSTDKDNQGPKEANKPFLSSTYVDLANDNSNQDKNSLPTKDQNNAVNEKPEHDSNIKVISIILYRSGI